MKPTKVTKEDLELAEELSRITTIKSLLDGFNDMLVAHFDDLIRHAEGGNPVTTYLGIVQKKDVLQTELQLVQAKLLQTLGEVGEEDAHELADPETDPLAKVLAGGEFIEPSAAADQTDPEIDEALKEKEE